MLTILYNPKIEKQTMDTISVQENGFLIELHQVMKRYESDAGNVTALKGINLQICSGEFVAITGRSGCGKTTLVNVVTGLDRCTAGEIWVAGVGIHRLSEEKAAVWRGRNVGIVLQSFQLLNTITILQNVMLPMDFANRGTLKERRKRALYLLDQVGIVDHAHKSPTAISGGQQQRVAIARALANDPPLIVADEPTGSLDSVTATSVFQIFESLVAQGKTILVVTHDRDLARSAQRMVTIADGEIVADRSKSVVIEDKHVQFTVV
jgi:putative ABC transport system ATP-binding protein